MVFTHKFAAFRGLKSRALRSIRVGYTNFRRHRLRWAHLSAASGFAIARRLAALRLMAPELDANYRACAAAHRPLPALA